MEKTVAIAILEDIQEKLQDTENPKIKGLQTISNYRKNLEIATNEELKELIARHTEYVKEYGEYDKKTLRLSRKIDKKMRKIYNN